MRRRLPSPRRPVRFEHEIDAMTEGSFMRTVCWLSALAVSGPGAQMQAADKPGMIGFLGDGTSVFPDADPPVEWQTHEVDSTADERGRKRPRLRLDRPRSKNVLWESEVPNMGSASPVVVGGKVFVLCEPGWPEGADAPQLACYDADTGRRLWVALLDPFRSLPEAERAERAAVRKRYFEMFRAANRFCATYRQAPPGQREALAEQARRLGYGYRNNKIALHDPWIKTPILGELRKTELMVPTWSYDSIGMCFATPVSDGKRIFVSTAYRTVSALDMNGRLLWQQWHRDHDRTYYANHMTARHVASPLIVDSVLLVHANTVLRAYDRATGKVLWQMDTDMTCYMVATPVALRLGGDGCVFTASGELVRARDGKILCDNIGGFRHGGGLATDGVSTIYCQNGQAGGHYHPPKDHRFTEPGSVAIRFTLKGEAAEAELLWHIPAIHANRGRHFTGGVYHKGVLYTKGGAAIDAKTGRLLSASVGGIGELGVILAGGRLYGRNHNGECPVAKAEDGKTSLLTTNRLPPVAPGFDEKHTAMSGRVPDSDRLGAWYSWNFGRSVPFAQGKRLYIRGFDYVYCIAERQIGKVEN